MSKLATFAVGTSTVCATIAIACAFAGDAQGRQPVGTGPSTPPAMHPDRGDREGVSSPFLTGVWKFVPDGSNKPKFDTELRFISSSTKTVNLEYAFFDPDGNFCGCDRDVLTPNKTVIYTMLGELQNPPQFTCPQDFGARSGAVQALVFTTHGHDIEFDDLEQVGFQTTAFRDVDETSDNAGNFNFLTGNVMTSGPMQNIVRTPATDADMRLVHDACVNLLGPVTSGI